MQSPLSPHTSTSCGTPCGGGVNRGRPPLCCWSSALATTARVRLAMCPSITEGAATDAFSTLYSNILPASAQCIPGCGEEYKM
jgi:hypothetical protein